MSIKSALDELVLTRTLSIPKSYSLERLKDIFAAPPGPNSDSATNWVVNCSHHLRPPATESDIKKVEYGLEITIPDELRQLWQICDGAELFVVAGKWPPTRRIRHKIFGTSEALDLNRQLFANFRECLGDDPGYGNMLKSNYVAFCNGCDGNFQSILLNEKGRGRVFLLYHEFYYCPWSEDNSDLNEVLAETLEDWLRLVSDTGGWGGRGLMVGGL